MSAWGTWNDATDGSDRPLRLLAKPVEVSVPVVSTGGWPECLVRQGRREDVVSGTGPERVETGWWRGKHVRRDYYRVTCRSGRSCWVFRERNSGRWFLQGWFD